MTKTIKATCVLIGFLCLLNSFMPQGDTKAVLARTSETDEVKAVWVATVFSLDFPKKATDDDAVLKAELDDMIKKVSEMGYNTLFLQVRPSADAFYKSDLFPWSQYLTGTQGVEPNNDFDPLEYAVRTAHKNGVALHAWINPYRVTATVGDKGKLTEESVAYKYPELIVEHSDGKLYLNPGEPKTNELVIRGAVEIVRKYDVDGIHLDDYFYPATDFSDSETFTKYGGRFASLDDWRRNNVTELVRGLHNAIKDENENVIFSVSPCGIWANKESHPDGSDTRGKQAYYEYYADTRLWVKENLMDWIIPQIYWNIGFETADFEKLARWWNDTADGTNVKVCGGLGIYKAADETDSSSVWHAQSGVNELKRQTELLRGLKNVCGYAHYRLGSLEKSSDLANIATELNSYEKTVFTDVENYPWAKNAIEELYEKKIVNGMGDGTFGCARVVTRADFMVMLMRMLKKDVPFTENFSDVSKEKYYYNEIGMAKALGYTDGRGNNIFDPMGDISRQDMAVMAYRVLIAEGVIMTGDEKTLTARFSDADKIAVYAREAVAAMVGGQYLSGYETGEFKPHGSATRAETAVFLSRILNRLY